MLPGGCRRHATAVFSVDGATYQVCVEHHAALERWRSGRAHAWPRTSGNPHESDGYQFFNTCDFPGCEVIGRSDEDGPDPGHWCDAHMPDVKGDPEEAGVSW